MLYRLRFFHFLGRFRSYLQVFVALWCRVEANDAEAIDPNIAIEAPDAYQWKLLREFKYLFILNDLRIGTAEFSIHPCRQEFDSLHRPLDGMECQTLHWLIDRVEDLETSAVSRTWPNWIQVKEGLVSSEIGCHLKPKAADYWVFIADLEAPYAGIYSDDLL